MNTTKEVKKEVEVVKKEEVVIPLLNVKVSKKVKQRLHDLKLCRFAMERENVPTMWHDLGVSQHEKTIGSWGKAQLNKLMKEETK
jgi:hypothetical protein